MNDRIRVRTDALDWREIEGEVVALDLNESKYFALNRTGTAIWADLVEGATRAELVDRLAERHGIGADAANSDVDAFLDQLAERNLLDR